MPRVKLPQASHLHPLGYIPAKFKGESYPFQTPLGNVRIHKLTWIPKSRCNHEDYICTNVSCIAGWEKRGWRLFLAHNQDGREFADQLKEQDLLDPRWLGIWETDREGVITE